MANNEFNDEQTHRAIELHIGKGLDINTAFILGFARYDLAERQSELARMAQRFIESPEAQAAITKVRATMVGISADAIASFDEKRKTLWELAKICAQPGDEIFQPTATISAIGELNRMDGDHAAKKIDIANVTLHQDFGPDAIEADD